MVLFCHQSQLSGLHNKRLCPVVWYKRAAGLPKGIRGCRILLTFSAVDHRCQVYVNGERVGEHTDDYTPFHFDMTHLLKDGANELRVRVEDAADCTQPRGKQYWKKGWMGCWYTPVIGIWQTMYLEAVGERFFTDAHITPDVDEARRNSSRPWTHYLHISSPPRSQSPAREGRCARSNRASPSG